MAPESNATLRQLPKVDEVLGGPTAQELLRRAPRWAVLRAIREEIEALRARLLGAEGVTEVRIMEERIEQRVASYLRPTLVRVLNATGVVVHTNLGRAPLPARALARIAEVASGYCNLEYRLSDGQRGSRHDHLQALLQPLTGAEAHLVVNNNAAAVLLMLSGLCAGREVVISRGELVEIGGSFRIPDVMRAAGARLCEVGTTNRTHLEDYARAVGPETGALMKVHRSNFALVGFTAEVGTAELCGLARERGLPCLYDLGSGALIDLRPLSDHLRRDLPDEPTCEDLVRAGCDLVCFSCDKLLGGPQAGVICGRGDLIGILRKHPLMRALRPDKLTLAALCATLELYRDGLAAAEVPVLTMLSGGEEVLRARAERLRDRLSSLALPIEVQVVQVNSAVGGGSAPRAGLRSFAVAVQPLGGSVDRLMRALGRGDPPVVARIMDDRLILDVRTLMDCELPMLEQAFQAATKGEEFA